MVMVKELWAKVVVWNDQVKKCHLNSHEACQPTTYYTVMTLK